MISDLTYNIALFFILGMSILIFPLLFFIPAPYGRHQRKGFGPVMNNKVGWFIMESTAVWAFALFYFLGENALNPVPLIFLVMWESHYIHRGLIYPFQLRGHKTQPVLLVGSAIFFNLLNTYVNASFITNFSDKYSMEWILDPRMIIGVLLFAFGYFINRKGDSLLCKLRKPGESGYQIPRGWLFEWISCPNYLGEIIQWTGWAVAVWSLPGLAFAFFTLANLMPRAWTNHKWYLSTFPDYPQKRKALIPGIL
jgi:hypothetical protein